MAITKCAECGADVSTDAAACPQCGFRVGQKRIRMWHSLVLIVLGVAAAYLVLVNVGLLSAVIAFVAVQAVGAAILGRRNIS